ncbi:MAG: DUF924 family protein, partial [Gammaproteobacteria bacterium]
KFWFEEIEESQWWKKDLEFDELIARRFSAIHKKASQCELYNWRDSAEGRLAEIIILDQFSRNIYRGSPESFSNDLLALVLSQEAVRLGVDKVVSSKKRSFFYMPFMHSESAVIHEVAVGLYTDLDQAGTLNFELKHKAIIDRFGRYPHRNELLGRVSTDEEIAFLSEPGSSF